MLSDCKNKADSVRRDKYIVSKVPFKKSTDAHRSLFGLRSSAAKVQERLPEMVILNDDAGSKSAVQQLY